MCLIINLSDFNRNQSLKLILNYWSRGNYYNYYTCTVSNAVFFYDHEMQIQEIQKKGKSNIIYHSIYLFYLLINKILLKQWI